MPPSSQVVPFPVRKLTRTETLLILAFVVGLFLFVGGPIWTHRWEPDRSILWSYTPIPLLVSLCLLRGRRLRFASFLVETLKVVLLKFGITASLLLIFWSVGEPPPVKREAAPTAPAAETPPPTKAPSAIPPESRGELRGTVVGADGRPVPGALVWVAAGLERYTFAAPRQPARLSVSRSGFLPPTSVATVGQSLEVRSTDGKLHTLHVVCEAGDTAFNVPLLASGAERTLPVSRELGLCRLRCEVHPDEVGGLLELAHPFAASADASGAFTLPGVPAGRLRIAAAAGPLRGEAEAQVVGGQTTEVRLTTRRAE